MGLNNDHKWITNLEFVVILTKLIDKSCQMNRMGCISTRNTSGVPVWWVMSKRSSRLSMVSIDVGYLNWGPCKLWSKGEQTRWGDYWS